MVASRVVSITACLLLAACGGSTGSGDTNGGAGTSGGGGTTSGGGGTTSGGGGTTSGGGGTTSGGGTGGTSLGGASGGTAAGGATGGGSSTCGSSPPKDGSPCDLSASIGFTSAQCSWGDDPRPACRTRGNCNNGTWTIVAPSDSCSVAPKPAACPATPATAGTQCTDASLQCWYDDGTVCNCSPCEGGSAYPVCRTIDPPEWACVKPPAGCPNPAPQAGSACSDPDLQCGTSCELPIRCQDGVWQYGQEMCPICASPLTPIATPSGYRAIAELRIGDLVYSVQDDAIVAVPVVRIGSTPVVHHEVLRITLSDGGVLEISPGHPLANGNPLSSLALGSLVDEAHRAIAIEHVPYAFDRTYDILPGSSTGTYFAAGALLGSTLGGGAQTRSP